LRPNWIVYAFLLLPLPTAGQKGKTMAAHEHGAATLNMVIEGSKVSIEFGAPSMGITGFEHVATSASDKAKQETALTSLKTRIAEIVQFDPSAGCSFKTDKALILQEKGEEHSELQSQFTATCKKPLGGTTVSFDAGKVFPGIDKLKVQVLNGEQQTAIEAKAGKGSLVIAR
jgi:hypothetical protein